MLREQSTRALHAEEQDDGCSRHVVHGAGRSKGSAPSARLTADCQRKKGAWMKSTRAGRRRQAVSGLSGSAAFGAKKSGMQSFRYSLSGCFISAL